MTREHLTANQTITANWENISPPPHSLIGQMLSEVPMTVLLEMVNPDRRSSLASQFSAGNTPAWYKNLPTDMKSYFSVVKSQIEDGALTTTSMPSNTGASPLPSNTGASPLPTATASSSPSGSASASTAKAMAPAQPTGAITGSVVGALGVLGLALAL